MNNRTQLDMANIGRLFFYFEMQSKTQLVANPHWYTKKEVAVREAKRQAREWACEQTWQEILGTL